MPAFGLPATRLRTMRIEDLDGRVDHVVCINVLSNLDNYHRPLERLLDVAAKSVVIRESLHDHGSYAYVRDEFLDDGVDLRVHVNTYPVAEVSAFMASRGFVVTEVIDERTAGVPELVIGYPHYWKFLVASRKR